MLPNSVTPSSTSTGMVPLAVSWNGTAWTGTATGYSETVSDPANSKSYQFAITENPAAVSFSGNTTTVSGSSCWQSKLTQWFLYRAFLPLE